MGSEGSPKGPGPSGWLIIRSKPDVACFALSVYWSAMPAKHLLEEIKIASSVAAGHRH